MRIALDLFEEGVIGRDEALACTRGLDADRIARVQVASVAGNAAVPPVAQATSACTGIVSGPILGCQALRVDLASRSMQLGGGAWREGEIQPLDGNTGAVHPGEVSTVRGAPRELLQRLAALRAAPR